MKKLEPVIISCGNIETTSLQTQYKTVNIMEEVSFKEFSKIARKTYLKEMDIRSSSKNPIKRIAYSYNDIEVFTDHNLYFTNLCYLIGYFLKETRKLQNRSKYYLSETLFCYYDYVSVEFPNLKDKLSFKKISNEKKIYENIIQINKNFSKLKTTFLKLIGRILYCANFVKDIKSSSHKAILIQSSERYKHQVEKYFDRNDKNITQYVFNWNEKEKYGTIQSLNLLFKSSLYILEVVTTFITLLFYLIKISNESYLKQINHFYKKKSKFSGISNLINLSILSTLCRRLNKKINNDDELVFFGAMDIISRTFDQYFYKKNKRIFIKQNTQGATVEPAFLDFDEVYVGNKVTKDIFNCFNVSSIVRDDICITSCFTNKLKKIIPLRQKKRNILYIDESLPSNEIEFNSRLNVIQTINKITNEFSDICLLNFRLHPTVNKDQLILNGTMLKISDKNIEEDLTSADIIIGRQSTALFTPILAGKITFIVDPSISSFFSMSKMFYNINSSQWFNDIITFEKSLRKYLIVSRRN